MRFGPKAALGVAALVGVLALGTSAHAAITSLTFNKCLSGKIKQSGKGVASYTGCHAKGASKALPTDGTCITKATGKSTAAYAKLDAKGGCLATGDGVARDTDAQNYALAVDTAVGHGGGMPVTNKCDAAKQKLVGKYVAAITGCYAKSAGKAGAVPPNGLPIDGICTGKALTKLNDGIAKAHAKPPCNNTNSVVAAADAFIQTHTCLLDSANPGCGGPCGNGINDPGEKCDASAPSAGWAACGPTFTCTACNCACPTKVRFSGDATAPESILDTGWSGISHRAPIISNGDVRVGLSCAAANRPCGTCNITGVVANGAGELQNSRCTNDSSIVCTVGNNAPCTPGGGTCAFYFGSNLPLAAGGVTTCVANTFVGAVTGTANVETGGAATTANLNARVFLGISVDNPCARCVGDTTINDGVQGGTCSGGTRNGLACDSNGFAPGRPDFGETSLDCPLASGAIIANLPIDLTNSTGTVTKTLTASSPKCRATGFTTQNCLCDTCNNVNQGPCTGDAGCPASGGGAGICGGKRCVGGPLAGSPCLQCIGGSNHGANCTVASQCPSGACNSTCGVCLTGAPAQIGLSCNVNAQCLSRCVGGANNNAACTVGSQCPGGACTVGSCEGNCAVPGRSTASNECDDNTATAEIDCTDDGDGEGTCTEGPLDNNCTLASTHPQRGCLNDGDCGGGVGSCGSANRKCFLTGGLTAMTGTNTLTAVGMADLPMADASSPTLGAVFCVGPTGQAAVNNVAGLPGPGRVTIKGNAVGLP